VLLTVSPFTLLREDAATTVRQHINTHIYIIPLLFLVFHFRWGSSIQPPPGCVVSVVRFLFTFVSSVVKKEEERWCAMLFLMSPGCFQKLCRQRALATMVLVNVMRAMLRCHAVKHTRYANVLLFLLLLWLFILITLFFSFSPFFPCSLYPA
jgi:hypothetical protein